MFSITSVLPRPKLPAARLEFVTQRCADQPHGTERAPDRQRAQDDRLYFSVRSFGFNGPRHILQYAFVDDRGNVVLSSFGEAERPGPVGPQLVEDMPVEPFDGDTLDYLAGRICGGAHLVAFGRVLQAGLLPAGAVAQAGSVDCAWRRFLRVSRQRRIAFDRHQSLTLGDALELAGLPPLTSPDAAMRALAIRDLWMWMDAVELRSGLS
jgi:hypothetical protein